MDDKTLLSIIRRMDDMERRIISRLDSLDAFRSRMVGAAMVISGLVSIAFEVLKNK